MLRSLVRFQLAPLFNQAEEVDPRYSVCLRLIAATGIRRGKAGALRWSDIDWRRATIVIDGTVNPSNRGAAITSPKTRTSIRKIAMDETTLAQLNALRIQQQSLASSAEPERLIPPCPNTISRAFTKHGWRPSCRKTSASIRFGISRPRRISQRTTNDAERSQTSINRPVTGCAMI